MMSQEDSALTRRAKMVLDFNWTATYTQPGPRLYPHQWSWDSAFIAIGYAHYKPDRAMQALRHLFESKWANGLLPQIVFNPEFGEYFPGPNFWHAERSPYAPRHRKTSGVVQPPLHASAVLRVYRSAEEDTQVRAFLKEAFSHLRAWHEYLYRERDPDGEGLVYIRHPWESGMDNSPMWDSIMERLQLRLDEIPTYQRLDTLVEGDEEDRPTTAAYDRFAYLVQFFAERDYDEAKIREDCPFLVQDVLFNALLCQSERDLAEIARILGEDPAPHEAQAEQTAQAMNQKLWDEEHSIYVDFDLAVGQPLYVYVAPNFVPLYAGIPDEDKALRMLDALENTGFSLKNKNIVPVPSYDPYGYGFSPDRYWRGPVWININWLLMRGLERYGFDEQATRLRQSIVKLVKEGGFYEYFDPTNGKGRGSVFFSWTAALLLDVLMDDKG
jgi:glycogen debranching enzyme